MADRYPRAGDKQEEKKGSGGVEYITVHMKEIEYGDNGFIEVAKKVRKEGKNETVFYTIARGFYGTKDNARIVMGNRPNNQVMIPAAPGVAEEVADALFSITPEGLGDEEVEDE
jgi:hypothetical protein